MKTILCIAVAAMTPFVALQAQPSSLAGNPGASTNGLAWRATLRDGLSTTWEATEWLQDLAGGFVARPHRYVEVATGLNYLDSSGQWQESQDLIELAPDGGAQALRSPQQVHWNANLNSAGAITITTASNRVFRTRPLGLFYYDAASGKSVLLAALQDSIGQVQPPNQVVYKSALAGLNADLRYTYTKAAVESDLILLESPPPPEAYLLDPKTTRLELWHEWLGTPMPQRVPRAVEPDLVDETLDFGDVWFPSGKAYFWDGSVNRLPNSPAQIRIRDAKDATQLPVGKRWDVIGNRNVLVESVRWEDVRAGLQALPQAGGAGALAVPTDTALWLQDLPAPRTPGQSGGAMTMAAGNYQAAGLVLDWIGVFGSGDYPFLSGMTYLVSGMGYFGGTITFQPLSIIKYTNTATLLLYGPIVCNSTSNSPSVLTSKDDNGFGEALGSGNPTYAASPALWIYYDPNAITLSGLRIRWATTAVELDSTSIAFQNSWLENCQSGFYCNGGCPSFWAATQYMVGTPCYPSGSGCDCSGLAPGTADPACWPVTPGSLTLNVVTGMQARIQSAILTNCEPRWILGCNSVDATTNYYWNTNCWLYGVKGLSTFSPYHDWDGTSKCYSYQGGGTLITRRHVITVTHMGGCFFETTNAWIRFLGTDGQTRIAHCLAGQSISAQSVICTNPACFTHFSYDLGLDNICILVLDRDMPTDTVGYVRVLPSSLTTQLPCLQAPLVYCTNQSATTDLNQNLPAVAFNQKKQAFVSDLYSLQLNYGWFHHTVWFPSWTSGWYPTPYCTQWCGSDFADINDGDSGSPTWLLINNELVLIGVWQTCGGSLWAGPNANLINTTISNLDNWAWTTYGTNRPSGYTITLFPLTIIPLSDLVSFERGCKYEVYATATL